MAIDFDAEQAIREMRTYADNAIYELDAVLDALLNDVEGHELLFSQSLPVWEYSSIASEVEGRIDDIHPPLAPTDISPQNLIVEPVPDYVPPTVDQLQAAINDIYNALNDVADFDKSAPVIDVSGLPRNLSIVAPTGAPTINVPLLPTKPTWTNPDEPSEIAINLPAPVTIQIPDFDVTVPVDNLVAPDTEFTFAEEVYTSSILTELKSKILSDLQNGGYGIEPGDEQSLVDRVKERTYEANQELVDTIAADAAKTFGHPTRPGIVNERITRAIKKATQEINNTNREVYIKRSELFRVTRQQSLELAYKLENMLLTYHGTTMERALRAAIATVELANAIFEVNVRRLMASIDVYKAQAGVFQTRVQAEIAKIQAYEAQIRGESAKIDLQKSRVELYRNQLAAIQILIDAYKTESEVARIQIETERIKLEAFKEEINAYVAQVQAKTSEYDGYRSKIEGQKSRVQAFEAEARAYSAEVDAARSKAAILRDAVTAELEKNNHLLERYKILLEKYKTDLVAKTEIWEMLAKKYGIDVDVFVAEMNGAIKAASVKQQANSDQLADDRLVMKEKLENVKMQLEEYRLLLSFKERKMDVEGRALADKVTGALNTINTLLEVSKLTEE